MRTPHVIVAALVAVLSMVAPAPHAQPTQTIRIGTTRSFILLPVYAAEQLGYFKGEGITEKGDFTPREMMALRFATLMAQDHKLDDRFLTELHAHFTDPEIIALGLGIGQFTGFGRLVAALDLENPQQQEA